MSVYTPPVGFHFNAAFDVSGATDRDVRFRDVSGLTMELEEQTYNEGGENRFSHKFPVRGRYPDLVLKRGLLTDSGLRQWVLDAIHNLVISPVTVWVSLLDETHAPLQTYTVVGAWPKKWVVSDFNAESSEIVVETLELSYQYFRVD
ncbi:MAG: phage tail protein [Alphaproteobacteria bacterium]|nr:phage tail protein [Alphaproteobacteria bacterium]